MLNWYFVFWASSVQEDTTPGIRVCVFLEVVGLCDDLMTDCMESRERLDAVGQIESIVEQKLLACRS